MIILFLVSLFCLLLNIIIHGHIWIGILNTLLLISSLYLFQIFSHQKISSIKFPFILLLAIIPIFIHDYENPISIVFTLGIILLFLIYIKTKFNYLLPFFFLYLFIASLYAGGIIKLPFLFHADSLIFNDHWTNDAISGMAKEALYLPHSIRPLIFNNSVYLYVLLSKTAELFMIKNLYDVLLIANLYPLIQGIILDLKSLDKEKKVIFFSIFLVSFTVVSSRAINIFDTFLLISPFLIYFILKGFNYINWKAYTLLMILSFFVATSPF